MPNAEKINARSLILIQIILRIVLQTQISGSFSTVTQALFNHSVNYP